MIRKTARRVTLGVAAAAVGYGGFNASVQFAAGREIKRREDLTDVTERYAPIKIMGRYVNPFPEYRHQTLFEFGYRRITELFALNPAGEVPVDRELLKAALPIYTPDFDAVNRSSLHFFYGISNFLGFNSTSKLALTWFGQSCALAQLPGDVRVLTDPMFADYVVSPHVGPQRLVPAPVQPRDFPQPHVILVSHDHQDHLDLESIEQLTKPGTTWVVPDGVSKHFPKQARFIEMTWWDRIPMPQVDPKLGYEIVCTPAMHWSGRALYDSNTTLWSSFLVLRHGKPIFFHGGDSGYSQAMFSAIAQKYGAGCKVAMVPCGAYLPRWHLKSQHMAPFESMGVMRTLGAQHMVGVHWGTFVMSEEPFGEPPVKLLELADDENVGDRVHAPSLGKTMVFDV